MSCRAESIHVALRTVKAPGLWIVIGKFCSHSVSHMKSCPTGRGSGSQAPIFVGYLHCMQSQGHGQDPAKGKINVLVWYAEESQGHG